MRNLIRWIFVGLFLTVCAGRTTKIFYTEGGVQPPVLTQPVAQSDKTVLADGGDPFPPLCPKNPCPGKPQGAN